MRFRLSIALLISLLLVSGALWTRFADSKKPGSLAIIPSSNIQVDNSAAAVNTTESINLNVSETSTSTQNLTTTDLIGRSLLSDYINLAANGEDTQDKLSALANKYADQMPSLNSSVQVTGADIQTVSDNTANFQKYADGLSKIHKTYSDYINKSGAGKKNLTDLGPDLYFAAEAFSVAYTRAADNLKALPVPLSLAELHLKLINSYYSSATAMSAISEAEKDSASAFAGLITLNSNLKQEDALVSNITQAINRYGI